MFLTLEKVILLWFFSLHTQRKFSAATGRHGKWQGKTTEKYPVAEAKEFSGVSTVKESGQKAQINFIIAFFIEHFCCQPFVCFSLHSFFSGPTVYKINSHSVVKVID